MKVIMTATRQSLSASLNARRNDDMLFTVDMRIGRTGIPVQGVWEGITEQSYMFTGVDSVQAAYLHHLANAYEQDAILIIKDDGRCIIHTAAGDKLDVGDWHKVPREIAIQFDGYSVIGGEYFIAAHIEELHAAQRRLKFTHEAQRRMLAEQAALIAANEYTARVAAVGGV